MMNDDERRGASRAPGAYRSAGLSRTISAAQGVYYLWTGLWPVFHMRSFEAVTGPKVDNWLVKTVGLLIAAIGGTLLASARDRPGRDVALLGLTSAAALGAVDLIYVAKGRIPPVYLLDAGPEAALAAAWGIAWPERAGRVRESGAPDTVQDAESLARLALR